MDWTYECLTYIDEFESAQGSLLAAVYGYPDNDQFEHLSYDSDYLPTAAIYSPARLRLSLATIQDSPQMTQTISADRSIAAFSATFDSDLAEFFEFNLYSMDGEWCGYGALHQTQLPAWLTSIGGGECFVIIQLEYEHELTKEESGLSEEEIAARREQIH